MKKKRKEKREWLEFDLLQPFPEVAHGVFPSRLEDGQAKEVYTDTFHLLGLEKGAKITPQIHGATILPVGEEGETLITKTRADGLITTQRGIGLLIRHADCQGAIFYDPVKRVLAAIHCGWRGSVKNIYQATVTLMTNEYGTNPTDLLVCIGPSLGPQAAEFTHFQRELPPSFWDYQTKPLFFDFWKISQMQLLDAGILKNHIEMANICTYSENNPFFSYRRNPRSVARNGIIVGLKKGNHI